MQCVFRLLGATKLALSCFQAIKAVYTILQPAGRPAGRQCGGAAAANFRTADYYAAGRTPTTMQPARTKKSESHEIWANLLWPTPPPTNFLGGWAPKILKPVLVFWILLFRDYCQEKFGPCPNSKGGKKFRPLPPKKIGGGQGSTWDTWVRHHKLDIMTHYHW